MKQALALLFALCSLAIAQSPTLVTVAGPVYDLTGVPFQGSITLTLQAVQSNGVIVRSKPVKVCTPGLNLINCTSNTLIAGAFSQALVSNGSASPAATSYTVVFAPSGGSSFTEYWSIPPAWAAHTAYTIPVSLACGGQGILDPAGNIEIVTTPGTSGSSAPSWNATVGGSTSDTSPLVWKNVGHPTPALIETGACAVNPQLTGPAGSQGVQGTQGTQGTQGIQGIQGAAGPAYVANVAGTCVGTLCTQIVTEATHLMTINPLKVQCWTGAIDGNGQVTGSARDCPSGKYSSGSPGDMIFSYTSGEVASFSIAGPGAGPAGSGGGGGGSMTWPSTAGIATCTGTPCTVWSSSLGLVTTVGSPGADTNVASEKAVRTALTTAVASITAASLGLTIGTNTEAWSANLDSWSALAPSVKQNAISTGTTAQYFRGDLSLATFPTTWAWGSLSGVPSTFAPINTGDWAGTWQSHSPSYFQTAISGAPGTWPTFTAFATLATGASSKVVLGNATLATLDTSIVPENGNLYFTNARVYSSLSGTSPIVFNSSTGAISCPSCGGGGGSAAGANGAIQASDGSGNFIDSGLVAATRAGGAASSIDLLAGTATGSIPSNTFRWEAPTTISTPYAWHPPSASTAGSVNDDGSGNLYISTWTGTGNDVHAASPTLSGTTVVNNLTISGTCSGCSSSGGATKLANSATFAYSAPICDGCCLQGPSTISITGVIAGDSVAMGATPSLADGINVLGKATASNTITVEVCNWSGVSVTPASTTYLATVVH